MSRAPLCQHACLVFSCLATAGGKVGRDPEPGTQVQGEGEDELRHWRCSILGLGLQQQECSIPANV